MKFYQVYYKAYVNEIIDEEEFVVFYDGNDARAYAKEVKEKFEAEYDHYEVALIRCEDGNAETEVVYDIEK